MKVLAVASEIYPLIKTGGLADVAGALPRALALEGVEVFSVIPGFPAVLEAVEGEIITRFDDLFGGPAAIILGRARGLHAFVIDAPHLFARGGNPYLGPDGRDWPDNAQRFAALSWVASEIGLGNVKGFVPDVVHAHDWPAGLTPFYLQAPGGRRPASVMTVHNISFQGLFPAVLLDALRLPSSAFDHHGFEFHGSIGFLKAGLYYADRITTVSPTYATEIQTTAGGMGLEGLLHSRKIALHGILNGIDEEVWNPASDPQIIACFDKRRLAARAANKPALKARLNLAPDPSALLFGVVSRLSHQKGLDLLLEALPTLLAQGAQLALLGSGDQALEHAFAAAQTQYPSRVGVRFGYDEPLAHLMQAGLDALLVPSRYEPCGLTQMCALRYGAIPVVARVGGLADSIIDANAAALSWAVATGLQFSPVTREGLEAAIDRAAVLWRQPAIWRQLQRNAMKSDVGWSRSARQYVEIFRLAIGELQRPRADRGQR
jgi:starch synthase